MRRLSPEYPQFRVKALGSYLIALSLLVVGGGLGFCAAGGTSSGERYANIKVQFVNPDTGWIFGPRLLGTANGGRTWATVDQDGLGTFKLEDISLGREKIQFINPELGWIVEGDGVAGTTNGGRTWSYVKIAEGRDSSLESLFFISPKTGWVVGRNIYRTGDGGLSWALLCKTPEGDPERQARMHVAAEYANYNPALWFTDDDNGFMARLDGEVYKSNDGGKTWGLVMKSDVRIEDIFFLNRQAGWMTNAEGEILRTVDGGKNWASVRTPTKSALHDVFLLTNGRGGRRVTTLQSCSRETVGARGRWLQYPAYRRRCRRWLRSASAMRRMGGRWVVSATLSIQSHESRFLTLCFPPTMAG